MRRLDKSTKHLSEAERSGNPERIAIQHLRLAKRLSPDFVGYPRASSLHKACIRMHVLGSRFKVAQEERLGHSEIVTYGIGAAVHYWLQNTDILFGENRHGWWKCLACGKIRRFGRPPRKRCPRCGASASASCYREHSIQPSKPLIATGHPDMFCKMQNVLRVVEIKTMTVAQFKGLVAPLVEHQWQIQYYMMRCSLEGELPKRVDGEVGYILYVSKQALQRSLPVKMFAQIRDADITEAIKAKLKEYRIGVKKGQLPPPLLECKNSDWESWKARKCACSQFCKRLT